MINKKIIAVDFDGTLCENKFPGIGEPNYGVINYLKRQKSGGDVILILWTCRVEENLQEAIWWCAKHNLGFDYINENAKETIEEFGTESRKIFAHEYIDDRAVYPFGNILTSRPDSRMPEFLVTSQYPQPKPYDGIIGIDLASSEDMQKYYYPTAPEQEPQPYANCSSYPKFYKKGEKNE